MRKFVLLNDFLWGIANMVCFLWLGGSSGDLLTEGLLLFDLSSSLWQFQEEQTQYNKRMLEYTIIIDRLKDTFSHEKNSEIKKLEREKNKCHRDWEHKKLGLINNSVYALALIITFALSALPFLPVTVPALLIISVVGTVLCFTITVINNAIRNGLEIRRACLSSKEAKMDLKQKIADFKELVEENGDFNDYKIILFLEIKQLRAETEHQQQMITYQTMHFIRSLVIQSLIPTLLFVSFVFLPVGIGIPVVGAGFLLAIVSYLLIERNFKPEQVTSFAFDSEEYQEFCNDPDSWDKIPSVATQSLFKVEAKPGERDKNSPSSPDENTLLPDNNMS